jgi:hypothetical protein
MFGLISGIKLLGIFGKFKDFIKDNWKLIAIVLLVAGTYIYHKRSVSNAFTSGQEAGILIENKRINDLTKIQNEKNRKTEDNLSKVIIELEEQNKVLENKRTSKETIFKDKIITKIKENIIYSQCIVEPSIIEERNNIRKLGPTTNE